MAKELRERMESAAFEAMKSPLIRITSDHQTEPAHDSSRGQRRDRLAMRCYRGPYLYQQFYTLRRATYIATTIHDLPVVIFPLSRDEHEKSFTEKQRRRRAVMASGKGGPRGGLLPM